MSMADLRFDGRTAVVTGAGRGLGRAYARLLAARGAKVVVNDTGVTMKGTGSDAGPAAAVVEEIRAAGGEAMASTDSVATPEGGRAIVEAALDRYGRLDILVHNAGIVRMTPFEAMTQQDFDMVLDVHLRGAFHVVRSAFPAMRRAGYGRIVLTSSVGGLYGSHQQANYAAAKTGMIGLSNTVALEGAAAGVKCNIILPGAITRMADDFDTTGFPPNMTAEIIAPVVGWLSHETCSVNGQMLVAQGGRVAKAFIAETPGVYRDDWSIEDVAREMGAIGDASEPLTFPSLPQGHLDHIHCAFMMRDEAHRAAAGRGDADQEESPE
jgi:NAD(P)-dependent dehydrogenase (short-subunit alcohol dehydrogenase family)